MRKLALALPEVEEKSHFEQPDFRVRNKIFAGLSRDGSQGNLKLSAELQAMVLSSNPKAFSPATGAWGRSGWTMVQLAQVSVAELAELLREAHALIAPKSVTGPARARAKPLTKKARKA
jgi:hypothetical protein